MQREENSKTPHQTFFLHLALHDIQDNDNMSPYTIFRIQDNMSPYTIFRIQDNIREFIFPYTIFRIQDNMREGFLHDIQDTG